MSQRPQKIPTSNGQRPSLPPTYPAPPSQTSKETALFLQFKQEYEEFKRFCRNSLMNLRKELENVLFCCFLQLLRLGIDRRLSPEDQNERSRLFRSFFESGKTIFLNPRLIRDLCTISSSLNLETFPIGFSEYLEKFLGVSKNIVYLSQFAYECLFSFFEFEKMSTIQNLLPNFLVIKRLKDEISEANYKGEFLRISSSIEDLERMNTGFVQISLSRSDLDLYQALDSFLKKRAVQEGSLKRKNKEISEICHFSDELKTSGFSENSGFLPISDVKLVNRVVFCQNYLERLPLNEKDQPSILQVTITDPQENITCVELGLNCNVLLCGNLDSSINLFLLNPQFLSQNGISEEANLSTNPSNLPQNSSNLSQITSNLPENSSNLPSNPSQNSATSQGKPYFSYKFLGHSSGITSISLQYDELYFLSSSIDTSIRLWCLRSRSCLSLYQGHINTIWRVKFNPKGYYFASGSSDTTAKLWTLDRVSPIRIFCGHSSDVTIVEFLQNSLFLVSCGLDNKIIFWEIASGNKVRILFHYQENVSSLCISPSGMYMVTGSEEGSVIFWDLGRFMRLNCWEIEKDCAGKNWMEKKNKIGFLGFSCDESCVFVGNRKKVAVFMVKTLKEKKNLDVYKDLKEEGEEEKGEKKGEIEEANFYDNQGMDFFLTARFHEKNHIVVVSKNLM